MAWWGEKASRTVWSCLMRFWFVRWCGVEGQGAYVDSGNTVDEKPDDYDGSKGRSELCGSKGLDEKERYED